MGLSEGRVLVDSHKFDLIKTDQWVGWLPGARQVMALAWVYTAEKGWHIELVPSRVRVQGLLGPSLAGPLKMALQRVWVFRCFCKGPGPGLPGGPPAPTLGTWDPGLHGRRFVSEPVVSAPCVPCVEPSTRAVDSVARASPGSSLLLGWGPCSTVAY